MKPSEIIVFLIEASDQIQVFHWQTESYAEHKALGKLYESLADARDAFAEILMREERVQLKADVSLIDYKKDGIKGYVGALSVEIESWEGLSPDLMNMRDDLLASVHRTQYLLSLS